MADDRPRLVRDLFDQVADLPPAERAAVLDAECRNDPALRAEVESLLTFDAGGADGFLQSPLVRPPAPATDSTPVPTSIGHYRIVGRLGEGGMGVVYEAEQEHPRRPVALKVIRPGLVSPALVKRFLHEAEVLGRLQHAGIAQVYDAGVTGEGQPFFAMELIRGVALDEYARPLDTPARLRLLAKVCDAVQHAHEKGVIHRDLKPANILVDEAGQPKVLDFGVARATDADLQTTTGRTEVGQLIGTLAYMSPEQFAADPRLIDSRTDVYALGVLLFEMLAGRPPYDLAHLPLAEAARVVRDQEPSRLGSLNTHFRGDVETIAAKALEKDRQRRYGSAAELAADIRRHLGHEPIQARPASALYQLRKFARRNKALVGGVAGVMAALVLGMIGTALFAVREANQHHQADLERQAALRQSYRARIAAATAALQSHDIPEATRQLDDAPQELRDWEWRHLHGRLDESTTVWPSSVANLPSESTALRVTMAVMLDGPGHGMNLAYGPGGLRLYSVSDDRLRLMDADGRERLTLPLSGFRRIGWVGVRGDGLSVVDTDGALVRLLDETGTVRVTADVSGTFGPGVVAVHQPLARLAVAWHGDPSARVFDLYGPASRQSYASCRGHTDIISALAFSPDGAQVASSSEDGTARLWEAATGAPVAILRGHTRKLHHVAFSPDGSRVLTAAADGTVRQWDPRTAVEVAAPFEGHTGEVLTAEYSPDGQWVASAGSDRTVRLWPAARPQAAEVLHGHMGTVYRLAFSADGRRLASASRDGTVRIWESDPQVSLPVLRGHTSYVYPVAYSPDGHWIASGSWDKSVRLWDAVTGEPCGRLAHKNFVRALAFGPDSSWLVSGCDEDEDLNVWDVATAQRRKSLPSPSKGLNAVTISPDGERVYALDRVGKLSAIDIAAGRPVAFAQMGAGITKYPLAVSPDGRWLAGVLEDTKTICLWDARTLRPGVQMVGHTAEVYTVSFSPDGRRLVSAGSDRTVRVWAVDTGQCQLVLKGHTDEVFAAVMHPDGTRIASAGRDQAIYLWDVATAGEEQMVARLQGHTNYVYSLAFSPDGGTLASGSGDGTMRLWDTEPLARRHQARREAEALRPEADRLVARLFAELGEPDRVVARLRADAGLSEPQREAALRAVMRHNSDPSP